jgi:hypothetical protein
MSVYRKLLALRILEKAVRKLFRAEESSLSGMHHGRLAADIRRNVPRLKRLAHDDADESDFWRVLQQTILKIVEYLHRRV